jgi:hypothetical protein
MLEFPCADWLCAAKVFFALVIGHAVADFPLQGEFLALGKNRRYLERLADPARPPGEWIFCMGAHCLIHAGAVWAVTGSALLGLVELVLHWMLDSAKCAGRISFAVDQWGHVLCKACYVLAGMWFWQQAGLAAAGG